MHGRGCVRHRGCAWGVHGGWDMCGVGHAWQWGTWLGGGSCMTGGMHDGGGGCFRGACMAAETETAADGTHPTGMHSCCLFCLFS